MLIPYKRKYSEINLNTDDIKTLKKFSESVLGKKFYVFIESFFKEVWSSDVKYKVFIARKCLNLMYIFYKCSDEPLKNSAHDFYSDSALLANVYEISQYYLRYRVIPEIMVVDDVLIHGRAISRFLNNLVYSILKFCEKYDTSIVYDDIMKAVQAALTIKVMVQNSKPLLMEEYYIDCLDTKLVRHTQFWREFSLRTSQLIAECPFAYTSYVLSLYELSSTDQSDHKLFSDAAKRTGFTLSERNKSSDRYTWVKPLINQGGDIVALYTIRMVPNGIDKRYKITPFMIVSDMHYNNGQCSALSDLGFDEYINEYDDITEILKSRAEALNLILSHNILLLLQDEIIRSEYTGSAPVEQSKLDIEKISFSFRKERFSEKEDFFDKLITLDRPLMTWEEMDNFILSLTMESEPLFANNSENCYDFYDGILEDVLALEGEQSEELAYKQYTKQIPKVKTFKTNPVKNLFEKKNFGLDFGYGKVTEFVGNLLKCLDNGIASLGAICEKGDPHKFICVYHPGEQSLFVRPRQYARYLPVLIEMEDDCNYNLRLITQRIAEFFADDSETDMSLASELSEFVERLYSSGQRLVDWNINLTIFSDDEDCGPDVDVKSDDISISQKIRYASGQLKELIRYHQMYLN